MRYTSRMRRCQDESGDEFGNVTEVSAFLQDQDALSLVEGQNARRTQKNYFGCCALCPPSLRYGAAAP
jgi:hypothetical protein